MSIHFIMQGKGGVGKSLIASILIQYFLKQGLEASGCDTDPVNSSLARHQGLKVKIIDIMDGDEIDPGRIDQLMNHIAESPPDSQMVVDIGASCFVALCAYLKKYNAFEVLEKLGFTIYIHTVITGGVNLIETLNNFKALIHHFNMPMVVWLNPFFGAIKIGDDNFEDSKICHEASAALYGIIEMPKLDSLLLRDFADMQARHQTFEESLSTPDVHLMNRQRLVMIWRKYQNAIDTIRLD